MKNILNALQDELDACNEIEDANTIADTAHHMEQFVRRCRAVVGDAAEPLMDNHNIYIDDALEDLECEFSELGKLASSVAEAIQEELDEPTIEEDERSMLIANSGVKF